MDTQFLRKQKQRILKNTINTPAKLDSRKKCLCDKHVIQIIIRNESQVRLAEAKGGSWLTTTKLMKMKTLADNRLHPCCPCLVFDNTTTEDKQ